MPRPSLDDDNLLRRWRDQTVYRLVLRASRVETTSTLRQLETRGWRDVTLTDTNLLANLDTGGTTITALAHRAGITRQAASQQVAALERRGYVRRLSSPTDARTAIVIQTEQGRRLLDEALDIVSDLEEAYEALLGPRRMSALKRTLTSLLDEVDPAGKLASD